MSYHLPAVCDKYHHLVRDFSTPEGAWRPVIVVLCGSTRFSQAYRQANLRETLAGKIVLSIGCDTKSDEDLNLVKEAADGRTLEEIHDELDVLHKRKIDLADEVLILNVDGYIGKSTMSQIEYAQSNSKPIRYLQPEYCIHGVIIKDMPYSHYMLHKTDHP